MRLDARLLALALLLLGSRECWAQSIATEESTSTIRVPITISYYVFTRKGRNLPGIGAEAGVEKSLSSNWNVGLYAAQGFGLSGGFSSLFTAFEVCGWYAVTGRFTQLTKTWSESGETVATYIQKPANGLRLGVSTQQYYFNSTSGATPFTAMSVKTQYEFAFSTMYTVAIGAELGTLSNADPKTKTRSSRAYLSFITPLDFK